MECITSEFCCGCLSRDRKIKPLSDYWCNEEIYKLLPEVSPQISCSLLICWECEVHITKFIKFKQQLKLCWQNLQDYIKEPDKPYPKTVSKLVSTTAEIISIESQWVEENHKIITGSPINFAVKLEVDSYSDDDRTLMDIITEEKDKEKDLRKEDKTDTILREAEEIKDEIFSGKDVIPLKENDKLRKGEIFRKKDKLLRKEIKKLRKGDRNSDLKKREAVKKRDREVSNGFEKIELTQEEILKERTEMELKEDYANSMFRCEHCILPFANEDDLKEHIQKKHSLMSKHKCDICTRSFPNATSLERHTRRHSTRWRCAVCRHLAAAAGAADTHYRRIHAQPTGEIHDLAAKAYGSYEEKSHENSEARPKSTDQIPCEHCSKTFRWRTSLRKHMETHNIESGHKRRPHCEPCNLTFTTTSNLKKHMQCSSKHQIQLKLRKLKQDPPLDASDPALATDIENIKSSINSQKEQFPCPQCEKKFQWKGNLWRHLQSHAARAKGALVCEPCNRTFSSIATYKQHMEISRKHVTENEYKHMCSECGKRFYNKIKLRDHVDWEHLKIYTHVCHHCQKIFKSHTSLYLHKQVVHKANNSSHLCDHCGKSFPNKTKLRSHVSALHTKETPYKCSVCAARFSWHSCLSRHMRRVHRIRNGTTSIT